MTKVENHFEDSKQKALDYVESLYEDKENKFVFKSENKGVKISFLMTPESSMPVIRGDLQIPPEIPMDDIQAIYNCVGSRHCWDDRFESFRWIDSYYDHASLVHISQKGSWPVSPRDFLVLHSISRPKPDQWKIIQTSVEDLGRVPETSGTVRGHMFGSLLYLKPSTTQPGYTEATYIIHVDVKGTLPPSFFKLVSTSLPLCLANIVEFHGQHGTPPTPTIERINQGGVMMKFKDYQFDIKSKQAVLKFDAAESETFQDKLKFKLNSKMYPNGIEIRLQGNAVILKDNDFVTLVAKKPGEVTVIIKKRESGNANEFTLIE